MMTSNQINKSLVAGICLLASAAWALPEYGTPTVIRDKRPTACEKNPKLCAETPPPPDPTDRGGADMPRTGSGTNVPDRPAKFEGKSCNDLKQQEQNYLDKVKVAAQNLQDSKDRKAALENEATNPLLSDSALSALGATEQQTCSVYKATRTARLEDVGDCGDARGRPCRAPTPTTTEVNQQIRCENATNENRTRRNELQTLRNGISSVEGDIRDRQKTWAQAQQNLAALREAKKNACPKP
jgi:hypothetical protein